MSDGQNEGAIDLIRWTFHVRPDRRAAIEAHLNDLGLDVHARGEGPLVATWDEPEGDLEELIEELWGLNGEPFEVTHEEFRRLNLLVFHHDEEDDEPGRAVA